MIKLYDIDAYICKFEATVMSCEKVSGGFKILLDRTAFFPTAGGQEFDPGNINGYTVLNVFEENENIYHVIEKPLKEGEEVCGELDMAVRFRKMQHHTAEHIVSGIVHNLFGYENTGFHLSGTEVTIDYSGELSRSDLLLVEQKANQAVWQNRAVRAYYPDTDELSKISYRSKSEIEGAVRIVDIDGIDVCACCAPHVMRTGEIGVIKLSGLMRHRGGARLNLICGGDALRDYEEKAENTLKISNLLSAKQSEIFEATERLSAELAEQKKKLAAVSKQLAEAKAELIPTSSGSVCMFEEDIDTDAMRALANRGKEKCGGIFAVFSGKDAGGYSFVMTSNGVDMRAATKDITAAMSARGGGGQDMIQGFAKATRKEIESFFEEYGR